MKQIFIFGSSLTYGVGASKGGWSNLLKEKLHTLMYAENGVGEKYEVFNFGKSGATIDFVQNNYKKQLELYGRNSLKIALVNVGGNNAKAINKPDNYVSKPEDYKKDISLLLSAMKEDFDYVYFIEGGYYDELKVRPKLNPFDGSFSYFSNDRKQIFNKLTESVCLDLDISYIRLNVSEKDWLSKYIYKDGLHPNDYGHRKLFENTWKVIKSIIINNEE